MTLSTSIDRDQSTNGLWLKAAQLGWLVLAILALALLVVSVLGYILLYTEVDLVDSLEPPDSADLTINVLDMILSVTAAVLSLGLAALLFWRKRDERMTLFLAYFSLFYGIIMAGPLETIGYFFGNDQTALLAQSLFLLPVVFLLYIFPTGAFVPRWSRWLVLVAFIIAPPTVFLTDNIGNALESAWSFIIGIVLLLLLITGFYGQIVRYRHISSPRERLQVKWVVYGVGVWFLVIIISSGPYTYLLTLPENAPIPGWVAPLSALWWLGLMIVPISFTVAILRYRLWDIDFIIRRTIVYALLTALLVLIYFGSVVVLQSLFTAVSGQQSPVVIVISTLIIAALFQPLRQRIQGWIDRRFFRAKYDASQALARFSQSARDEVDLEQLTAALLQVTRDTLQPESVWLWLPQQIDGEK
jgi:hypothetical protein